MFRPLSFSLFLFLIMVRCVLLPKIRTVQYYASSCSHFSPLVSSQPSSSTFAFSYPFTFSKLPLQIPALCLPSKTSATSQELAQQVTVNRTYQQTRQSRNPNNPPQESPCKYSTIKIKTDNQPATYYIFNKRSPKPDRICQSHSTRKGVNPNPNS